MQILTSWRAMRSCEFMKPHADYVTVSDDTLRVELSDGRTISVPLAWYPRLVHATQDEPGS